MNWWQMDGEGLAGSLESCLFSVLHRHLLAPVPPGWSNGARHCSEGKIPTCSLCWERSQRVWRRGLRRKADWPALGIINNKTSSLWPECWDRWNHFCISPCSYYISTYSYSKGWVTPITRLYLECTRWQTVLSAWSWSSHFTLLLRALACVSTLTAKERSRAGSEIPRGLRKRGCHFFTHPQSTKQGLVSV